MTPNQREKVLGELGVIWVTYGLTCAGWDVFRKINEKGFDLLARRSGKEKWIEVKSRDCLNSTGKNAKYVTVGSSASQNQHAEYLAIYVHGFSTTILLPTTLPVVECVTTRNTLKAGKIDQGRFIIEPVFAKYENNFDLK